MQTLFERGIASSRIIDVRKTTDSETHLELPRLNPATFSAVDRELMFHVAVSAWQDVFSPTRLLDNINSQDPSPARRAELKSLRRFGLILRTGYKFFDDRHSTPHSERSLSFLVRCWFCS